MTAPTLFPEITRDEVFRLETKRLWLRWPHPRDVQAMQPWIGLAEVAQRTASWPVGATEDMTAERLARVRSSNSLGSGLTLALTPRGDDARVVGLCGIGLAAGTPPEFGYQLDPDWRGLGLMPEAVAALARMAFWLLHADRIAARVVIGNTASRRVLEKCGFELIGDGICESQLYGTRPVHRFELQAPVGRGAERTLALTG